VAWRLSARCSTAVLSPAGAGPAPTATATAPAARSTRAAPSLSPPAERFRMAVSTPGSTGQKAGRRQGVSAGWLCGDLGTDETRSWVGCKWQTVPSGAASEDSAISPPTDHPSARPPPAATSTLHANPARPALLALPNPFDLRNATVTAAQQHPASGSPCSSAVEVKKPSFFLCPLPSSFFCPF
jgi:hypothetical protein